MILKTYNMMKYFYWVLFCFIGCSSTTDNHQYYTSSEEGELKEPDPLELFNNYMFGINRILDAAVIKPVAISYDMGVPSSVQYCIKSFLNNLYAPISALNYSLQGQGEQTAKTVCRFILNSTFGLFGLIDFASFIGIEEEKTGFNETFASWGIESGPYIMLPVLGSTTFRGALGYGFDWLCDPFRIVAYQRNGSFNNHKQLAKFTWIQYALYITEQRAELLHMLDDIYETSVNPYATIRSIIFQKQKKVDKKINARSKL